MRRMRRAESAGRGEADGGNGAEGVSSGNGRSDGTISLAWPGAAPGIG